MRSFHIFLSTGFIALPAAIAGTDEFLEPEESIELTQASGADLFTGEGVSLGGILFPHLHINGAYGVSSAEDISSLSNGHHDPQSDFTLQALEPGLSLRAGMLEGFATYSASTDESGEIDGELEEAFLKLVDLPGGFEIRGGRFLNRFGFQNALHSHAWENVNNTLVNGRILQEGEIITDGGEITWNLPSISTFRSALSFSYGVAPAHEEDHGHGEEEEEPEFEGEGARFVDDFYTASYTASYAYNDFHNHRLVLSAAWGDNEFGRDTQLYGLGYEYAWRENGLEPGGRSFRWRSEVAYRTFDAVSEGHGHEEEEEHGHEEEEEEEESREASLDDLGFYTSIIYGINDLTDIGIRAGYVPSISDAGLEERWRISPSVTLAANRERTLYARLQYDYDNFSSGDEHSLFLQLGFNWGGAEVR